MKKTEKTTYHVAIKIKGFLFPLHETFEDNEDLDRFIETCHKKNIDTKEFKIYKKSAFTAAGGDTSVWNIAGRT